MTRKPASPRSLSHGLVDDVQAFGSAMVLIALGLHLLTTAQLMVGGVPGMAVLLRLSTGWPLGLCLFLMNMPFYVLAWRTLGIRFTGKTLLAMTSLSVTVEVVRSTIHIAHIDPLMAAVAGGVIVGVGLLILLRHQASLGGTGVLAIYLHRRLGWNIGLVQLVGDATILAVGAANVDPMRLALSVLAALALNLVLLWNHRPDRYIVR